MTDEELANILAEHDGTLGFARQMCPTCQTVHPCLTFRLAVDLHQTRTRQ